MLNSLHFMDKVIDTHKGEVTCSGAYRKLVEDSRTQVFPINNNLKKKLNSLLRKNPKML